MITAAVKELAYVAASTSRQSNPKALAPLKIFPVFLNFCNFKNT